MKSVSLVYRRKAGSDGPSASGSRHGKSGLVIDCAILLALAAVLRFLWLGRASLWIDELFSVHWSQSALSFLMGEGARTETNPPAYYILLHGWMKIFGTTEFAVRAPSALVSVATVAVVYALGRMMFDRRTAILAGIFMAVNLVSITFAQEARSYALSAWLNGLGLLSIVVYVRRLESTGHRSWTWLAAFMLAMIATSLIHYTSLLFVAACFAAIGFQLLTSRPFPAQEAIVWTGAGLVVAALLSKYLILAMTLSGSNNLVWIEPLSLQSIMAFVLDVTVPLPRTTPFLVLSWIAFTLLLLFVTILLPQLHSDRGQFAVLVLIPGIYCGLLIAVSWLRPMLLARIAIWLQIPLCLLLAQAVVSQPHRWQRYAVCGVPLLIFLFSLGYYYRFPWKEDWREAAGLVITEPQCHGPVLIGEFNALGLLYYGVQTRRQVYVFLPDARRRNSAEFNLTQRLMQPQELSAGEVQGFIEIHPGTVVIIRAEYADVIPPNLQYTLTHAPFNAQLGDHLLACF